MTGHINAGGIALPMASSGKRIVRIDWDRMADDLAEQGAAVTERLLSSEECRAIASLYPDDGLFRSRIIMARHGFGKGEYKYFRLVFAVHHRPVNGTRGAYGVNMRHGVSRIRSGRRHTLGLIFHDAQ